MKAEGSCAGHKPPESVLEYIETYYKIHGYERVDFQYGNEVPHANYVHPDTFKDYYLEGYFRNKYIAGANTNQNWHYVLFGHQGSENYMCYAAGRHLEGVFIADYDLLLLAGGQPLQHEMWRRTALMHEFGHTVGILVYDFSNNVEIYCSNWCCCMAKGNPLNVIMTP